MKLWVDDVRPAPDGYVWCKSVDDAISTIILRSTCDEDFCLEIIDLDHDAGNYVNQGGDYIAILDFIEEHIAMFEGMDLKFRIHSMNPVGRQNMQRVIEKNGWKLVW